MVQWQRIYLSMQETQETWVQTLGQVSGSLWGVPGSWWPQVIVTICPWTWSGPWVSVGQQQVLPGLFWCNRMLTLLSGMENAGPTASCMLLWTHCVWSLLWARYMCTWKAPGSAGRSPEACSETFFILVPVFASMSNLERDHTAIRLHIVLSKLCVKQKYFLRFYLAFTQQNQSSECHAKGTCWGILKMKDFSKFS